MQSDFLTACQQTRERMEIPPMPVAAIRVAARRRNAEAQPKHRRTFIAAVIASLSLVAAAAAAVLSSAHISYTKSGTMTISGDGFAVINHPTQAQIRELAAKENFAVLLPSGLPAGTTLAQAASFGPGAFGISYNLPGQWRISHHLLRIVIANRTAAASAPGRYEIETGPVQAHWTVGDEEVTALGYAATPAEITSIKRSMLRAREARK